MADVLNFEDIVGPQPSAPHPFGIEFSVTDEHSTHGVPHRVLKSGPVHPNDFKTTMRQYIVTHHASPENIERDRKRREALARHGFNDARRRFPINLNTQKGNWGEIFLAEYLASSCSAQIPVYRLRYNPNVDQSMKGDDVLAFDLDSDPVRILIGEAKFRSTPSKQVVEEIVHTLVKSHQAGIPVSLQFVVDRLFEEGHSELAAKVDECSLLFAQGRLRLDHIGLLVSDVNTARHVNRNAKPEIRRLAVMSLCLNNPDDTISACYERIEDEV